MTTPQEADETASPEQREYQQEEQRVDEAEQDKPSADPAPEDEGRTGKAL